ncbi:hypothetical protein JVT61DRAFT_380 [Boletus reticuloceps]|uniref:Uncharacterized protein n=1 Tax=Boletus reticuloceps TaxID=495285 RepID=A0A8I2YYD0_9AGAM|nr:hypothetical protein JVT61DRAFT_380 [Boletus reticuloceps]
MAIHITTCLCLLSLPAWLVAAQKVASQAYTPMAGPCPRDFTLVRMAGSPGGQSLSTPEAVYVQARQSQVIPQAWKTYLADVEATNVTLPSYVSSILSGSCSETPNFGIATSRGGYRPTAALLMVKRPSPTHPVFKPPTIALQKFRRCSTRPMSHARLPRKPKYDNQP